MIFATRGHCKQSFVSFSYKQKEALKASWAFIHPLLLQRNQTQREPFLIWVTPNNVIISNTLSEVDGV